MLGQIVNIIDGWQNPPKLPFAFNDHITIDEQVLLNQGTNFQ